LSVPDSWITVPLEEIRRVGKEGTAPPTRQGIPV
jgi:hypothetical protein